MSIGRFSRFVVVGGFAALVNIGSRWLLGNFWPFVPSIIMAYVIGMATAFLLNRRYVFAGSGNSLRRQVFWFTMVNLAAVLQTIIVSVALADWLLPWAGWDWHRLTVAHVVGVMVPVLSSYIGHKRLSFNA